MLKVVLLYLLNILFSSYCLCAESKPLSQIGLKFNPDYIQVGSFKSAAAEKYDPVGLTIYKNDHSEIIRLLSRSGIDTSDALAAIRSKIEQMRLLFTPRPAPYTGTLSMTAECLKNTQLPKKPRIKKQQIDAVFLTRATKKFIYGSCEGDQEIYASQYLVVYCRKNHTLYEIKLFTDREKNLPTEPIANCI
jgi:hypothetical protein